MTTHRIERLRNEIKKLNVDAFLVSAPKNVRYLTNFTGSAGHALITEDKAYFITDFRYTTQASQQAKNYEVIIHQTGLYQAIQDILQTENVKTVAIEGDHLNVTIYNALEDLFSADMVATSGVIEYLREVKDEDEIAQIKKAAQIQDKAYEHILKYIQVGMSEIDVANELERYLKTLGASAMSFDTIVASGWRSAMPHGVASDKLIEDGDIITLDFGCYYNGYTADMTRTFAVGSIDPELEKIYQVVYEAQRRLNEQIQVGMTGSQADAVTRDYITEQGYGEYFGHSTGHGIGLDVHEGPRLAKGVNDELVVGNVVTNEPGIYIEGVGGVRIEDDIYLSENGPVILNDSPKELIII